MKVQEFQNFLTGRVSAKVVKAKTAVEFQMPLYFKGCRSLETNKMHDRESVREVVMPNGEVIHLIL